MVLGGNFFEFAGKVFKQLIGTAMGTRAAPTYACLFMGWLEQTKLLGRWTGTAPHLWRRFIDDVFFIWKGTEEELQKFIEHINKQHSHIKFTASYDIKSRSVPFLDMEVSIDDNNFIQTDLHKKKTARVQSLMPSSCHPSHITKNIPYSLAYRLLRICSSPKKFEQRLEELRQDLFSRGYKPKIVNDAFERVKTVPREKALEKVVSKENTREVFATTFHPALPPLTTLIRKHHAVMTQEDPDMKDCFPSPSLVCYKRFKNLRDILIKAKVNVQRRSKRKRTGYKMCGESGGACYMCTLCRESTTHKSPHSGETWEINSPIDCDTKNIIYKLECTQCPKFLYIGETSRRAKDRYYGHRSNILRKQLDTPAGHHFNLPKHNENMMRMLPIERVRPANNPFIRLTRESWWIKQYDAIRKGTNKKK